MKLARMYDVGITNLILLKLTARVTYLIGKDGRIQKAFQSVKPAVHASEVLAFVSTPVQASTLPTELRAEGKP